jgi:hypothetical protein
MGKSCNHVSMVAIVRHFDDQDCATFGPAFHGDGVLVTKSNKSKDAAQQPFSTAFFPYIPIMRPP